MSKSEQTQDNHSHSGGCPVHLLQYDWYHGKLSQEEANKLLNAVDDPCFLVREEKGEAGTIILSVKNKGRTIHFPVSRGRGLFKLACSSYVFETVGELVTHYMSSSHTDSPSFFLRSPVVKENIEPSPGSIQLVHKPRY